MLNLAEEFIILGAGRTGSTCLVEMLDSHEQIVCLPEILEKGFIKNKDIWEKRFEGLNITDSKAANYYIIRDYCKKNKKIFGFKFLQQNEKLVRESKEFDYENILYKNKNIRKIIITRNLLETYISDRTGIETNKWAYEDTSQVKIHFKYDGYVKYCYDKMKYYQDLLLTLSNTNQIPLIISYSNIVNKTCFKNISKFLCLSIEPDTLSCKATKQNSHLLHDRVINYEQMIKLCEENEDPFYREYKNRSL